MTSIEKFELNDSIFERLWGAHNLRLKKHALRLTRDAERAQDLFQETAIRVFMNMDKMESEQKFLSWTMRIMQNIFLDMKRKEVRRPTTVSFDELGVQLGHEVDFEDTRVDIESEVMLDMVNELNSRQLRNMIATLKPVFRESISLNTYGCVNSLCVDKFAAPMDYNAIASVMNTDTANVRVRISRAKKSLVSMALSSGYAAE